MRYQCSVRVRVRVRVAQTERIDAQMFTESRGDVAMSYAINPKLNCSHC